MTTNDRNSFVSLMSTPGSSNEPHSGGGKIVTKKPNASQTKKQKFKEWKKTTKGKRKLTLSEDEAQQLDASRAAEIASSPLVQTSGSTSPTQAVAIDCEMVGSGPRGNRDQLARVSIVNTFGHVLYDKYVKPLEVVTDYRSFVSGIYPHHLVNGEDFYKVQREVCELLKGRTLVGHAVNHDLKVLFLKHPSMNIRDTSKYFKSSVYGGKGTPSLRRLTDHHLKINIQGTSHDSVEDARATMRLYVKFKDDWESGISAKLRQRFEQSGLGDVM